MSFGIEIEKDADGVRVKSVSGLDNVPDGVLSVSGHTAMSGSPVSTLSVTLTGPVGENGGRKFLASASASYMGPKPAAVPTEG